jgi:hypothetical protein
VNVLIFPFLFSKMGFLDSYQGKSEKLLGIGTHLCCNYSYYWGCIPFKFDSQTDRISRQQYILIRIHQYILTLIFSIGLRIWIVFTFVRDAHAGILVLEFPTLARATRVLLLSYIGFLRIYTFVN